MKQTIEKHKYVELTYKTVDRKSGAVYTSIEYPVGYVHGVEESILSPEVMAELEGQSVGDIIKIPIDCDKLYGPRDESLVFTDHIENVPEQYREVGMTVVMENSKGEPKNFLVTRFDDKTLTVDGNNPLCGRSVDFTLEITMVRKATEEEIALGGKAGADPELDDILKNAE